MGIDGKIQAIVEKNGKTKELEYIIRDGEYDPPTIKIYPKEKIKKRRCRLCGK